MSFSNDDTLNKRFEVSVDDLIELVGLAGLNDRLDEALDDEPHTAVDVSYQVVGCVLELGGSATLTFEASYTPDPIFEEQT